MGITLHALVERLHPADEYSPVDTWMDVARWDDFGKHFALKEWLREHATKGWPKDSDADEDEANEVLDIDRCVTTSEQCVAALTHLRLFAGSADPFARYAFITPMEALVESVRVYEAAGYTIRVLWGCC
jgi:hypothetical protein